MTISFILAMDSGSIRGKTVDITVISGFPIGARRAFECKEGKESGEVKGTVRKIEKKRRKD